jgi:hypothetical protein
MIVADSIPAPMRLLLLAVIAFLSPLAVSAQTDPQEKRQSNIIREYDRFEDRTKYWTRPKTVRSGLDVMAHFSFKGKGAGNEVDGFYLIFTSMGSDWRYLKDSRLYCLIDGDRVDLGSARASDSDIKPGYSTVEVKEILMFPVKYPTLQRISNAKRVEVRLGNTEFYFDEYFRESLKELLAKVRVVKRK